MAGQLEEASDQRKDDDKEDEDHSDDEEKLDEKLMILMIWILMPLTKNVWDEEVKEDKKERFR